MPRRPYDQVVTLNKRKRGIIRKAIELCKLCDQDIYIAVFDQDKNTLVQYKSSQVVNPEVLASLQNDAKITHEKYDNEDYEELSGKFLTKEKFMAIQEKHKETWA